MKFPTTMVVAVFLDEAVKRSAASSRARMERFPASRLERMASRLPEVASFREAVAGRSGGVGIIAEVKRRSPSAGDVRKAAKLRPIVERYAEAGACAVSILTSEYGFAGDLEDLSEASRCSVLPLLRKDFITSEYQVLESRAYGASAVLLIAAVLKTSDLARLMDYSSETGLTPLVEVHREAEMEKALEAGAGVIGINNRDLGTLEVDLKTTERLMGTMPEGVTVISESGIRDRGHVRMMEALGVDALLVGEVLMKSEDPGKKLRELLGEVDERCGSRSAE